MNLKNLEIVEVAGFNCLSVQLLSRSAQYLNPRISYDDEKCVGRENEREELEMLFRRQEKEGREGKRCGGEVVYGGRKGGWEDGAGEGRTQPVGNWNMATSSRRVVEVGLSRRKSEIHRNGRKTWRYGCTPALGKARGLVAETSTACHWALKALKQHVYPLAGALPEAFGTTGRDRM